MKIVLPEESIDSPVTSLFNRNLLLVALCVIMLLSAKLVLEQLVVLYSICIDFVCSNVFLACLLSAIAGALMLLIYQKSGKRRSTFL